MRTLFEAGVHFGHLTRFRNPEMREFIYGVSNNTSIINLEKTLPLYNSAMSFITQLANRNAKILFVGTKRSAKKLVAEYAASVNMPYVDHRWLGGMLTNYKTIRQSVRRMFNLQKMIEDGTVDNMTKKEGLTISRQLSKLEDSLGGIKDMNGLPDALFVIDVGYERIAVQEANKLGIPVIGVVDTNSSPEGINYMIPGNDDAMRSIRLYLESVTSVIKQVQEAKRAKAAPAPIKKFKEEFVEINEEASAESTDATNTLSSEQSK